MIAPEAHKTQVLVETSVWRKLHRLDSELEDLSRGPGSVIPAEPGRDVQIWPIRELPAKPGLSSKEGQARLLHDLASIELQAMELGIRTLSEFPDAPRPFREQLSEITREEGLHLRLCLEGLEALGFPWGRFPAHNALWRAAAAEDTLLDRIVIVHRYLEGSGLDASQTLIRRLHGVKAPETCRAVSRIAKDELAHVQFGSRWYHELVRGEGRDARDDFAERLARLRWRVPRRLEPIDRELRLAAGFSECEIRLLEDLRRDHEPDRTNQSRTGSVGD